MSKTIEIIVSPTGQMQVETKGFTGAECREASRFVEEALGKSTGEKLTGEFHETSTDQSVEHELQ
jgi:hypothetical protein